MHLKIYFENLFSNFMSNFDFSLECGSNTFIKVRCLEIVEALCLEAFPTSSRLSRKNLRLLYYSFSSKTHINGVQVTQIIKKFSFSGSCLILEAQGQSGSIWCLWGYKCLKDWGHSSYKLMPLCRKSHLTKCTKEDIKYFLSKQVH